MKIRSKRPYIAQQCRPGRGGRNAVAAVRNKQRHPRLLSAKRDVARLRGQIQPLGRKNAFCFQLFGTAPVEERPCHAAVDHARLVTLLGKDWFVVRRQELHRAVLFFYHDAQLFRLDQNRRLRFFRTPRKRGICLRLPVRVLHFCGHTLYETDADHLWRDRGDA